MLVYSQNYLSSRLQLAALASDALVLHNLQMNDTYMHSETLLSNLDIQLVNEVFASIKLHLSHLNARKYEYKHC
jgi:hypothetical protein